MFTKMTIELIGGPDPPAAQAQHALDRFDAGEEPDRIGLRLRRRRAVQHREALIPVEGG